MLTSSPAFLFPTLPLCCHNFLDDFIYGFVKIDIEVKTFLSRNVSFAQF